MLRITAFVIAHLALFCLSASAQVVPHSYWAKVSTAGVYLWGSHSFFGNAESPIRNVSGRNWDDISVGIYGACAIKAGGLYCWGDDTYGLLGNGTGTSNSTFPQQVGTDTDWQKVSVRWTHACAIKAGGLYCWGTDIYGEQGNGTTTGNIEAPTRYGTDATWTDVAAGTYVTCAIKAGTLWCAGRDGTGEQGNGSGTGNVTTFAQVLTPSGSNWTAVSAGVDKTVTNVGEVLETTMCGIKGGQLYCWGDDTYGQVGNGSASSTNVTAPTLVDSSTTWTKITNGRGHTCGLRGGSLYCWGNDGRGQQGNGTATTGNIHVPTVVDSATSWSDVAAGELFTCGVKAGALYCWGSDSSGEQGNGTVTGNVTSPIQIGSALTWQRVSASAYREVETCDEFGCGNISYYVSAMGVLDP